MCGHKSEQAASRTRGPRILRQGKSAVPLHDLGYRGWDGELNPQSGRWWVIAQTGVRLAWRSRWLRRMLVIAWFPAVLAGLVLFFVENAISRSLDLPNVIRLTDQTFPVFPWGESMAAMLDERPANSRAAIWPVVLLAFFRMPQGVLIVMLTALVAPSLIAQDMRSRAYLLYFSRPITRLEYVLGKMATVAAYQAMITAVPGVALYLLGVGLSPDLSVIRDTWDLPLRIIASSVVVIVPTVTFSLSLSALLAESRYATFCWFAPWILGWAAFVAMTAMKESAVLHHSENAFVLRGTWSVLSPYHALGEVESWIFGITRNFDDVAPEAMMLSLVTLVSLGVLLHKVSSPMRV